MARKFISKVVTLSATTLTLLSLTACSFNNKKSSKDSTIKTEASKDTPEKKEESKDKTDAETKKDQSNTQKVTNNSDKGSTTNNTGTVHQSTPSKTTAQPHQPQATVTPKRPVQNTKPQAQKVINNAHQAVTLVAHAMGDAAPEIFSAVVAADGYHVYMNDSKGPITVVKSNGDFYDTTGHLTGKFAAMAAPDGPYNRAWNPNR